MYIQIFRSFLIILVVTLISCSADDSPNDLELNQPHIEYFGFTLIDTYWDDPTDNEAKINYADEVASFTNIGDILVVNPSDDLIARINQLSSLEMKTILHLAEIFYEFDGNNSPSGTKYGLRSDYQARWNEFTMINNSALSQDKIAAFYIGEEPTWNGISFEELQSATDFVKVDYPNIPTMIIEAFPAVDSLHIPTSVDWIGFDHYFINDPRTNLDYQRELAVMKSKRSKSEQRLVVIMDTHYIDWAHGDFANLELQDMTRVARNYYDLANADPSVIAILGYFWPNGFDTPESIGARGMPNETINEYIRIGEEITGKN